MVFGEWFIHKAPQFTKLFSASQIFPVQRSGKHHYYHIALLMFVPLVNIVMLFVLGAKGSRWAWKNNLWKDETHFVKTQRNWAIAGVVVLLAFVGLGAAGLFGVTALMKSSEAYKGAMQQVRADPRSVRMLGEPIESGWFISGSINVSGASGKADIAIPVSGPRGGGTVYCRAEKQIGTWVIYLLVLRPEGDGAPVVLVNDRNLQIR